MQNDMLKLKDEFKSHVCKVVLDVVGLMEQLPMEQSSSIICDQLKSANECKFWLGLKGRKEIFLRFDLSF